MKYGYLIPHTHWDREWRYPIWENRQYLIDLMEELLDNLRENDSYTSFLTDGQCVMLLDFLELRPERRADIEGYVHAGRLHIGPWYTLPDLYPVSGESLVRNLMRGARACKALGGCMSIGYESFGWGQPSQLPQLYQGFGIDTVIVSKNVDKTRAPHCEFTWEGKDGTQVLATRLGADARASFFMNTTLDVLNGMPYKSDDYRYSMERMGRTYHQADEAGHIEDWFRMEDTQEIHAHRIREAVLKSWHAMDETLVPDHRALMDGTDSTSSQRLLPQLIAKMNEEFAGEIAFKHASLPEYVALLKEHLPNAAEPLRVLKGELRDGPSTSLSANALMTRPHIKALNKTVQRCLFDEAEPLNIAALQLGERYDSEIFAKAEDYLLLSHPHDSINGVTQDKTVDDVLYRLHQALELAQLGTNNACKRILHHLDTSAYAPDDILLVVFNPAPFARREMVKAYLDTPQAYSVWDFAIEDAQGNACEVQHISRTTKTVPVADMHARPWPLDADRHEIVFDAGELPACGYKLYRLTDKTRFARNTEFWAKTRKTRGDAIAVSPLLLENEHLRVDVNANGTVNVTDKTTGNTFQNQNCFESTGDVGDYWMYYPPYHNETYTSAGCAADIWLEENGPLCATVAARVVMHLPAESLRPEKYHRGESKRTGETKWLEIVTRYTLRKGAKALAVHTDVHNNVRDHRFSVWFDSGFAYETVDAQGHFCVDRRPRFPLRDASGAYYNELTSQPMQSFVSVEDGAARGLGLLTSSIGEYDVRTQGGELGLTLFRAVKNIICTEMRSAGEFPNQHGGQVQQILSYDYAIYPFEGRWQESDIIKEAQRLCRPIKPVQTAKAHHEAGALSGAESFFSVEGRVCVSACKKSADADKCTVLVRVWNPYGGAEKAVIWLKNGITAAWLTDLNETRLAQANVESGTVSLTVEADKIVSVELAF